MRLAAISFILLLLCLSSAACRRQAAKRTAQAIVESVQKTRLKNFSIDKIKSISIDLSKNDREVHSRSTSQPKDLSSMVALFKPVMESGHLGVDTAPASGLLFTFVPAEPKRAPYRFALSQDTLDSWPIPIQMEFKKQMEWFEAAREGGIGSE